METIEHYMSENPGVLIVQNLMTGDWFIEGQKGESLPYVRDDFKQASRMYQAIVHFNATGVPKPEDRFSALPKSRFKIRKCRRIDSKNSN